MKNKLMLLLIFFLLTGCSSNKTLKCEYKEVQNENAYDYLTVELMAKDDSIYKIIEYYELLYSDDMQEAYLAAIDIFSEYQKCPGYNTTSKCSKYNTLEFSYKDNLITAKEEIDIKSAINNGELMDAWGIELEDGSYLSLEEVSKHYIDEGYSCK